MVHQAGLQAAQLRGREQNAQNAAQQVAGAPPPGAVPQVPLPHVAAVPLQPAADREVAGIIGEQGLVQDLLDPEVPGPHLGPLVPDATGWNMIDSWGVWDCLLCEFPTIMDIPSCYREIWAAAVDKVLTAIQEAEGGINLERGLKWFLILPKALFRQGRRGGKAVKGLISQRVNS